MKYDSLISLLYKRHNRLMLIRDVTLNDGDENVGEFVFNFLIYKNLP
jgi:hypothetical protein